MLSGSVKPVKAAFLWKLNVLTFVVCPMEIAVSPQVILLSESPLEFAL